MTREYAVLEKMGWQPFFEKEFGPFQEKGLDVARVSVENKNFFTVYTLYGEYLAETSGKLRYEATSAAELPKVGDWVVVSLFPNEQKAIIHHVLARKSKLSRKNPGKETVEQVIATNLDVVFIVQSLDHNFNLRRLERYLAMVSEGNIKPVVLLNKTDLGNEVEEKVNSVKRVASQVVVRSISAKINYGIEELKEFIKDGETCALIGSSGVGKSSIINRLIGADILAVNETREQDSRGRHTTTRRELILLPNGGLLIDTPGMRELHLWEANEGVDEVFDDIENIASRCYFSDCTHTNEIKCAVLEAVQNGEISPERYQSYLKLEQEAIYLASSYLERRRNEKKAGRNFKKLKQEFQKTKLHFK